MKLPLKTRSMRFMLFIAISSLFLSPASAENKGPVLITDTSLEGQYVEAIKSGDTNKAEQLLEHKDFDVDALNSRFLFGGKTLLMRYIEGGVDVDAPVSITARSLEQQFIEALKSGDTIKAKQLFEHKDFDVNFLDSRFLFGGKTILMWYIGDIGIDVDVAKLLLEHKDIDMNFKDPDGNTALMLAIQQAIKDGKHKQFSVYETLLKWAYKNGCTNMIEQLLEYKNMHANATEKSEFTLSLRCE